MAVQSQHNALDNLDAAFQTWDNKARAMSTRTTRFEQVIAVLGPVAVLCLTMQVVFFNESGLVAFLLIGFELLALTVTLIIGYTSFSPSPNGWMLVRLRAEVLRRESYLVKARVGPYLRAPSPPDSIVHQRLIAVTHEGTDPLELIGAREPNGELWLDTLHRVGSGTASPEPGCFEDFFESRLTGQRNWFVGKSQAHHAQDAHFEDAAKIVLVIALVLSAMHLAMLFTENGPITTLQLGIVVLAIVLPPVGSALAAWQTLAEGRRLAMTYTYHANALNDLTVRFSDLNARRGQVPQDKWDFEFKSLVLRTEEVLASEMRLWWLLRSAAK